MVLPVGAGLETAVHTVPFHCSIRGVDPPVVPVYPTAVHQVLLRQTTPLREFPVVEGGLAGVPSDQF